MAKLADMTFEVLLKPPSGEALAVGEFTVDLGYEVSDTATVQVHLEAGVIAQGLRELAQRVEEAEVESDPPVGEGS